MRRVLLRQPLLRRRQADFQEPGAQRALAGDERGAAGGAGLLAVIVGEDRALVGDAVDVGRAIAHHAAVVGADVPVADVVAHDDEDVGLLLRLLRRRWRDHRWTASDASRAKPQMFLLHVHCRSPGSGTGCTSRCTDSGGERVTARHCSLDRIVAGARLQRAHATHALDVASRWRDWH